MENGKRESQRKPRNSRKGTEGNSVVKRVFFGLGTLLLIGILTILMLAGIFMMYVKTTLAPSVAIDADDYTMKLSSTIYYQDKETQEWVEYQTYYGDENRIWVDYDEIPDAMWQAAVAIEDHRFFEHNGVDWGRTLHAMLKMATGDASFGGSTITQQTLKNITGDNNPYVNRKVREIFRALEFEKDVTKQEILELYLNTVYFGKKCYGVQTAAQYYFGKDVSELSVAECASIIAITNNPSMYGPMSTVVMTNTEKGTKKTARELNKQRQELIIDRMADPDLGLNYLTPEEAEAAKAEVLVFTDGSTSADDLVKQATGNVNVNSWFMDQVIDDVAADLSAELGIAKEEAYIKMMNSGYHIYTTLDPDIQELVEEVYADRSNLDLTSQKGQPIQSGITVMDPYTGNVVAIAGAMGPKEGNRVSNYATMKHQVGSSIKPLTVYAPAIDAGVVHPGTVFDNYPVRLLNDKPWPKNSPSKYTGFTTVQEGLKHSINTIAVQTVEALGIPESYEFATEKLNLNLVAEDMNTSSLGLGGLTYGLNTVEMAAAYSAFVNDGVYTKPRTYVKVTKPDADGNETVILENEPETHVAMKETTAYLMNEMLKTVITGGTGGSANFSGMTIAGKTGTTNDSRDRYFVGYTPYYVAAVWTGYKVPEKIIYRGNPSITMWKKVMQPLHEDLPNKGFGSMPPGITEVTICRDSGLLCSEACHADPRGDRAITVKVPAGMEPTEVCSRHVFKEYCTVGQCLATPACPPESVEVRAFLDYTRVDYGEGITAEDDAYLISNLEKKLEVSEENPAGGCPSHGSSTPIVPMDPSLDPNDPNYIPGPPTDHPGIGLDPNTGEPLPYEPPAPEVVPPAPPVEQPVAPTPTPPETGETDEFWDDLWSTVEG